TRLATLAVWVAGTVLSLGRLGMTVAPFLLGAGAFGVAYATAARRARFGGTWSWLGRHSYSLFLVHQPFVVLCVPHGTTARLGRIAAGIAVALVLTVLAAVALEWTVGPGVERLRRVGWPRVAIGLGLAGGGLALVLIGAELTVRRLGPREVWGW